MSDMTEIATSKLAQERGDGDAKTFASQMVTEHTKTSEELKALVGGGVEAELPSVLDETSQKKFDKLKEAKADDFTSDYASMQINAHKNAVSLFERYAKGGDDAKLKDWAGMTLPHLQHHLEMAQNLNKKSNRKSGRDRPLVSRAYPCRDRTRQLPGPHPAVRTSVTSLPEVARGKHASAPRNLQTATKIDRATSRARGEHFRTVHRCA